MAETSTIADKRVTQPRSVAAGDVVVSCEPWIWSFQPKYQQILCAQCFTESNDLRACSGCKLYRYCNSQCQAASWKKEHKNECGLLKKIQQKLVKFPACLDHDCAIGYERSRCCAAQMFMAKFVNKIMTGEEEESSGFVGNMTTTEVMEMLPCDDQYSAPSAAWAIRQPEDMALCDLLWPDVKKIIPNFDVLVKKITYNAQPLLDQRGKTTFYGLGIFPQALLRKMTPVCWDMNVTMDLQGRMLVVRATEDIPVFTGLQDLRQTEMGPTFVTSYASRRKWFQFVYGHTCPCRKCSREYEAEINPLKCSTTGCPARIPSDGRALLPCPTCGAVNGERLNQLRQFMEAYEMTAGEGANPAFHLECLMEKVDPADIVHPDAHFRFLLGFDGAMALAEFGHHKEAWRLCRGMVQCVRTVYPAYHLKRACCLVKAGVIPYIWAHKAGAEDQQRFKPVFDQAFPTAMEWLKEAHSIYEKLGGGGSQGAREVAKVIAKYGGKENGTIVENAYWNWNTVFEW